jgi:hypothetical protein
MLAAHAVEELPCYDAPLRKGATMGGSSKGRYIKHRVPCCTACSCTHKVLLITQSQQQPAQPSAEEGDLIQMHSQHRAALVQLPLTRYEVALHLRSLHSHLCTPPAATCTAGNGVCGPHHTAQQRWVCSCGWGCCW